MYNHTINVIIKSVLMFLKDNIVRMLRFLICELIGCGSVRCVKMKSVRLGKEKLGTFKVSD